MPSKKSTYQIWYEQVKRDLLVTEPQNILARSQCCQNIINECVSHIHASLGLAALTPSQQYVCAVKPTDHLNFLLNWPGLRTDNSPKAPTTKKEYEKKSKNWLNGRRAPNYGRTLFPFFIADAERYVLSIAKLIIPNRNPEQRRLYCEIVTYKILAQLCGCSVSLHEQAKKAPFFCKNSIERKGKLKEILQSYASDHEYIQGFPSCFEEAIGYFDRKSNGFFREYKKYMGCPDTHRFRSDEPQPRSGDRRVPSDPIKPPRPKSEFPMRPVHSNNASRNDAATVDAEYWKKQFIQLRRELSAERQMRMNVERERDNLKSLIHTSTVNAVHSPHIGTLHAIPLQNDNSYDSLNGGSSATVSTTSSSAGNCMMYPHSYGVQNMQKRMVHPSQVASHNPMGITQRQMQMSHHHPSTQVTAVHTMDAVHSYGPAMPSFVDNCSNNSVYNLNNTNDFQALPPNTNSTPNDAFSSTLIDSMPMMNREQQRSNESYPHQLDENNLFFKSPASLYSFPNNQTFTL